MTNNVYALNTAISIPLRFNYNIIISTFYPTITNFNSTKVQL